MLLGASSPFITAMAILAFATTVATGAVAVAVGLRASRTRQTLKRTASTNGADQYGRRHDQRGDAVTDTVNYARSVPVGALLKNRPLRDALFAALRAQGVDTAGRDDSDASEVLDFEVDTHDDDQGGLVDLASAREVIDRAKTIVGRARTARDLFDFDWDQQVAFVVPLLPAADPVRDAISVEDLRGLQAILKLILMAFPRHAMFDLKLPEEVTLPNVQNVLTICSSRRNAITRAILENPTIQSRLRVGFAIDTDPVQGSDAEQWVILFDGTPIKSPSYQEDVELRAKGRDPRDGPVNDVALLAKVSNPINASSKFIVVAGVRGFGTWGAAEFLRREADFLLQETGGEDFVMVVEVTRENRNKVSAVRTQHMRVIEPLQ